MSFVALESLHCSLWWFSEGWSFLIILNLGWFPLDASSSWSIVLACLNSRLYVLPKMDTIFQNSFVALLFVYMSLYVYVQLMMHIVSFCHWYCFSWGKQSSTIDKKIPYYWLGIPVSQVLVMTATFMQPYSFQVLMTIYTISLLPLLLSFSLKIYEYSIGGCDWTA